MTCVSRVAAALAAAAFVVACGRKVSISGKDPGGSAATPPATGPDATPPPADPALLVIDTAGQGSVRAEGISAGTATSYVGGHFEMRFDEGSTAKLTVFPATGWFLETWDGACSGAEGCSIRIGGRQTVAARFMESPRAATLLVAIGWGVGSIRVEGISAGAPSTQTCSGMRNACALHFDEGSTAKVTAEPGPGWRVKSYPGGCSWAEGCSIRIDGLQQVTLGFERPVQPQPPDETVYDAVDVTQLGGPNSVTFAWALDDTGAIAGSICAAPVRYDTACDLFLWDGVLHRIHVADGFTASVAATAGGRIVGSIATASGVVRAFVTRGQEIVELPTLGGKRSFASAVNASGVVVGGSFTPSGEQHAVLWRDGVLHDLNARTGKAESVAMAIDENGKVGVLACDQWMSNSGCRAMVMTDDAKVDLGALPDQRYMEMYPYAMNTAGQVVGEIPLYFWSEYHVAAVWSAGVTKELEAETAARLWPTPTLRLPEGTHLVSRLRAVAPSGAAVGDTGIAMSDGGAATAILWKNGKLVDLWGAVDPPTPLHSAFAINAKGQILAQRGEYVSGAGSLVLLTPR